MLRKPLTILLFIIAYLTCCCQRNDSALIDTLVKNIASAQVTTDDEFYIGMFPSFRQCGGAPHNYQPDNNIFLRRSRRSP